VAASSAWGGGPKPAWFVAISQNLEPPQAFALHWFNPAVEEEGVAGGASVGGGLFATTTFGGTACDVTGCELLSDPPPDC
jgi:hypothetical protein